MKNWKKRFTKRPLPLTKLEAERLKAGVEVETHVKDSLFGIEPSNYEQMRESLNKQNIIDAEFIKDLEPKLLGSE